MNIVDEYNRLLKEHAELTKRVAAAPESRRRIIRALRPVLAAWSKSVLDTTIDENGVAQTKAVLDPARMDQLLDALLAEKDEDALAAAEHISSLHLAKSLTHLPIVARDHQDATAEAMAEMQAEKDALVAAVRVLVCQQLAMAVKENPLLLTNQLLQSSLEEIRAMAGKPIPAAAMKELEPGYVKSFLTTKRLHSQLAERDTIPEKEKAIIRVIGQGAHTQRNIAKALGLTQQGASRSKDLENLIQKNYVELFDLETGVQGDNIRLHFLNEAGQDLYRAIEGSEPTIPQAQVYRDEESNYGYRRQQGYWIDELRFQAKQLGYESSPEKLRGVPGSELSVQPDLTVHKKGGDVPVQIELGDKSWGGQRAQVVIGVFKALATWGSCEVWVANEGMVESLSNELTRTVDPAAFTGGAKLPADAEVRFYILGGKNIRQFGDWPKTTATAFKTLNF